MDFLHACTIRIGFNKVKKQTQTGLMTRRRVGMKDECKKNNGGDGWTRGASRRGRKHQWCHGVAGEKEA